MRYVYLLCLILLAAPVRSQTRPTTGTAETTGPCSPAVTGANNQFTITCQGVSDKLGSQLVDLMNRIATNQIDAQAMMSKLDGCLAGVKAVREDQEPWHLNSYQKLKLKTALALPLPPPGATARLSVNVIPSDRNASLMGIDLLGLLKEMKWSGEKDGFTSDFSLNPALVGIGVIVTHADFPQAAALINGLIAAGFQPQVFIDEKKTMVRDDNTIEIAIGAKPPAPQQEEVKK